MSLAQAKYVVLLCMGTRLRVERVVQHAHKHACLRQAHGHRGIVPLLAWQQRPSLGRVLWHMLPPQIGTLRSRAEGSLVSHPWEGLMHAKAKEKQSCEDHERACMQSVSSQAWHAHMQLPARLQQQCAQVSIPANAWHATGCT